MEFPDLSQGPRDLIDSDVNKTGGVTEEDKSTALSVDISDEELLTLSSEWKRKWGTYWQSVQKDIAEAEAYWMGMQYNSVEIQSSNRPIVDNLIFEALETFLPEATKRNPEPIVICEATEEGRTLAKNIKTSLQFLADKLHLRLKIKRMVRYWSIYKLGVIKVGWDPQIKRIFTDVVRTPKLILDKDATIMDGGKYDGEYIGEEKEATAEKLIEMFPNKADVIKGKVEEDLGTKLKYIEWWTPDLLFFTMDKEILEKYRNPHWNYDESAPSVGEDGEPTEVSVPGANHFDTPEMPYTFLSVFNLGKHPLDDTSLIIQNLTNQDRINSTLRQIVKNVKRMNGGGLYGGELTKEQAAEAQGAIDAGDGVWIGNGDINQSFKQYSGTPLPADVFNHLVDMRSELRNIFGVKGSSAQGIASEQTVRGKVITSQKDASRIGGGISEYIEQCADRIFNWWVQLMYVYYEEEQYAAMLGQVKAQETATLSKAALEQYTGEVLVSVKEGSMLPQDDLTKANQAVELASAQLLSPIDLYDALDFPDPMETAKNLFMWQNMPQMLFPDLGQNMAPQPIESEIPPVEREPEPTGAELPPLPLPNLTG